MEQNLVSPESEAIKPISFAPKLAEIGALAFWRGPGHIPAGQHAEIREIIQQKGSREETIRRLDDFLPGLSAVIRDNIRRILTAALVAEKHDGSVLMVEGCRTNSIDTAQEDGSILRRNIPGSHMGMLIFKALQTLQIIPSHIPVTHAAESRCTDHEGDVAFDYIVKGGRLIGIVGLYGEPSAQRAEAIATYQGIKKVGMEPTVLEPKQALKHFKITPTEEQYVVFDATELRAKEITEAVENEAAAKRLQWISDRFGWIFNGRHSLLSFAASRIPSRKDKPRRERIR